MDWTEAEFVHERISSVLIIAVRAAMVALTCYFAYTWPHDEAVSVFFSICLAWLAIIPFSCRRELRRARNTAYLITDRRAISFLPRRFRKYRVLVNLPESLSYRSLLQHFSRLRLHLLDRALSDPIR